jgi:hypothetical protein
MDRYGAYSTQKAAFTDITVAKSPFHSSSEWSKRVRQALLFAFALTSFQRFRCAAAMRALASADIRRPDIV